MDLTSYVGNLGREFAALAETDGEHARALVERLTGSLESAIRMAILDVLSAAADEITQDLAPGSVELRLRGRDPDFIVTAPPAAGTRSSTMDIEPVVGEDGPVARINVRMPEQLKAAVDEAAAREGRSVNTWLVRAAAAALHTSGTRTETRTTGTRHKQHLTGWVR